MRKTIFSSALMLAAAWLCYPNDVARLARQGKDKIKTSVVEKLR